ncbi:uncharacterized protein A1O9_02415 [Exophiala aquamarina CBS 119918]|uniref:Transcription factor domain-containing protein n=1 Tax=Exophiala aquamarina CBS 119918 TaxID=1182545 RepID=A0A072PNF6_9EURO|nr:uncharacterized protein A1O9_02415 [Exophiala aquamarina CBS 119918]KEF60853.1 hypothetical protein A1O9_02415 [Exophiala aquamarina CBS 119918]
MATTDDSSNYLNWPDSTDLLQSILSAEFVNLPSLELFPSQPMLPSAALPSDPSRNSLGLSLRDQHSPWLGGENVVQNLSQIINNTSTDITSEAENIGITSAFLDGCLHMFFTEFVPSFPVVHAPTFVFKDWTHPLLLNAIALGSLFVGKSDYASNVQDTEKSPKILEHQWRTWAAKETKIRALLGHYILDGQISEYSGRPTSQRHTTHTLPMASTDAAFQALNAGQWQRDHKPAFRQHAPFLRLFSSLFSDHMHIRHLGLPPSTFNISVILEGLKSLTTERYPAGLKPVGVPSHLDLARARSRLYPFISGNTIMSPAAQKTILMRWHAISANAIFNLGELCRSICGQFNIKQHIFGRQEEGSIDLETWKDTPQAHLAILHANNIHQLLREMPLMGVQTIHVPVAIFGAGLIYCAFMLAGITSIFIPDDINWESVLLIDLDADIQCSDDDLDIPVRRFLRDPLLHRNANMHLLYDMNFFCSTLKKLEQPWGVSANMYLILQQMLSLCSCS